LAQYDQLPVFKACYDLILIIFNTVSSFTKEYKYTIGEKLKNETLEVMILVYRANSVVNKAEFLQEGKEKLELMRIYLRIHKDLKQINLKKLIFINERIEIIAKQLNAWQKWASQMKNA
jgi:CRISPR/Cas system-associated endonuclease Cas3-HD